MINLPTIKPLPDDGSALHERQRWHLPVTLERRVAAAMEAWRADGNTLRLWARDSSLWTATDEDQWLGWLDIVDEQLAHFQLFQELADEVKSEGFEHIVLLGMGGSSLCPEVLVRTFGRVPGFPSLLVLDSTDPAQIQRVASQLDFRRTLFMVSSKSGTTLEPNILLDYFYERCLKAIGPGLVGSRFIAVTDPASELEHLAEAKHFRHVFLGVKSIGGRFSALSHYGMVPAAATGLVVNTLLRRTQEMVYSCRPGIPLEENPGVMLGLILGTAGNSGYDKITLVLSQSLGALGAWIEQLLAESTGKEGKGLIPIDGEQLGAPSFYEEDRLFCYVRDKGAADRVQDAMVEALQETGRPVVRIDVQNKWDLGQEFFRWEIATATAGAVLGINPFNQPDVEASKLVSRQIMSEYEATGSFPEEAPLIEENGLKLFAGESSAVDLANQTNNERSVAAFLKAHLKSLRLGDYFALLAFMDMRDANQAVLQDIRHKVRDHLRVATLLGFGPRYLHSTGQAFKGGPNSGVFLQVTCETPVDLPVPGHKYSFGLAETAQAIGDFRVLAERGRRVLRVHLAVEAQQGLARLYAQIVFALV